MEDTTNPAQRTICDTCRRPLARHYTPGQPGENWEHHQWDLDDHAPAPRLEMTSDKVAELCDFCGGPEVSWIYPCGTFAIGSDVMSGGWTACRRCSGLIEQKKMDELAHRTSRHQSKEAKAIAIPMVRSLHRAFTKNRSGKRVPAASQQH